MSAPVFAVVGHPNKGKSSIVATLARDDSVGIAPEPGTTTHARRYPMKVDGETLYTLVDTPGFQRARRALAWMRERETSAAEHPAVVRKFIEIHRETDHFPDEVRLLEPLMEQAGGAGVLYVVDGAAPYGEEYEAEMEILRWTGRPSMGLINPIGSAAHVEPWRDALGQYFKVVRVFDPMTAQWQKRLELLRGFGQLQEGWRQPLERAVDVLEGERRRQRGAAAAAIAEMLREMLSLSITQRVGREEDPMRYKPKMERDYHDKLRNLEARGRRRVEELYGHHALQRRERELELEMLEADLFNDETWLAFGLKKLDLAAAGAASGAAAGGVVDAAVGGASFLAGMGIGAIVGGAMGWYGGKRATEFTVASLPLGGKQLRCGPMRNTNFGFVVFNRARLHHTLVANRTHAQRGEMEVPDALPGASLADSFSVGVEERAGAVMLPPLPGEVRRGLAKRFGKIAKGGGAAVPDLGELVERVLGEEEQ